MPALFSPPVINMIVKSSDSTYTEVKTTHTTLLLWYFIVFLPPFFPSFLLFFFFFIQILIFQSLILQMFKKSCLIVFLLSFSYLCRFWRGRIEQPEIFFCVCLSFFSDFSRHLWSFLSKQFLSFKSQHAQEFFDFFWNQLIYLFLIIFSVGYFLFFFFFNSQWIVCAYVRVLLCYFKAVFYQILNHHKR